MATAGDNTADFEKYLSAATISLWRLCVVCRRLALALIAGAVPVVVLIAVAMRFDYFTIGRENKRRFLDLVSLRRYG